MNFKVLITLLALAFSSSVFAQNRMDGSVSFKSEMILGSQENEVSVTIKNIGGHTYMDFKRKGEFFQINLTSLNKSDLFEGYEKLKTEQKDGEQPIENSELVSSIGFRVKGEYKASSECEITFSTQNVNGLFSLVINFPEIHDFQSQNEVFESRVVVINDSNVQIFEKALLEESFFVSIHVHN